MKIGSLFPGLSLLLEKKGKKVLKQLAKIAINGIVS